MPRSVRTFLPVPGDPEAIVAAFTGDPLRWLPADTRRSGEVFVTAVHAGAFHREVAVRIGQPWQAGPTRWRSFSWDPLGEDDPTALERLLPSFDGELGLHVYGPGRVTLLLDGRYAPPGGAVGAALDAAGLHRVAQTTVERLLEDLAVRLAPVSARVA